MDSRLTKKRLFNFFSYEWIIIALVIAASILLMELLYTVLAVRLSVGQQFKIYFDENISANGSAFIDSLEYGKEDSVFSYDILDFSSESLIASYNVLSTRLSVYEGDMIITDTQADNEETPWNTRANILIDNGYICDYKKILEDAKKYLKGFLDGGTEISIEAFNNQKVEDRIGEYFLIRQKKDNRFRSDKEKEEGKKLEIKRIKDLVSSYLYFEKAYNYGVNNGWFYSYRRFEYSIEAYKEDSNYQDFEELYNKEEEKNYGLNVSALNGEGHVGEHSGEEYFKVGGNANSDNTVLMVFDFVEKQKDLQFESIAVINRLIENCSGFKTIDDIPTV